MESTAEIDAAVTHLTNVLASSIKNSVPPSNRIPLKRKAPWWNKNLCAMRYKLRQLQKQCTLNTGQLIDRQDAMTILRTYKSLYQIEISRAKSAEWKRFCTEELVADPFKAIRKLTGRLQHSNVTTLTSADGVTLTDEEQIFATPDAHDDHSEFPLYFHENCSCPHQQSADRKVGTSSGNSCIH